MKINDTIGRITAEAPKIPELEGHIKIELFNAETGELEECVEGKNLVTNVVRDVFASNYFGLMSYDEILPIMDTFFGGILLFKQTLVEDADDYYIPRPADNELIGHAGQDGTAAELSADSTMGLPIISASGATADGKGYTRVWTFDTAHGNGPIAAIGMTHPETGRNFKNNMTPVTNITDGGHPIQQLHRYAYCADTSAYASYGDVVNPVLWWDEDADVGIQIVGQNGTTLTVRKIKSYGAIEGVGLLQPSIHTTLEAVQNRVIEQTFTMPQNVGVMRFLYKPAYSGHPLGEVHCLYASGRDIVRRIIDIDTMTMTTSDLQANTGISFTAFTSVYNNAAETICLDIDGYLYLQGSGKIYRVNYSDITDISEVAYSGSFTETNTINGLGHYGCSQMGGVLTDGETFAEGIHIGTGTDYNIDWYRYAPMKINPHGNQLVYMSPRYNRNYLSDGTPCLLLNKLFLSTIKNLDSAVAKTSTQTMQITYTITEVEPQE